MNFINFQFHPRFGLNGRLLFCCFTFSIKLRGEKGLLLKILEENGRLAKIREENGRLAKIREENGRLAISCGVSAQSSE